MTIHSRVVLIATALLIPLSAAAQAPGQERPAGAPPPPSQDYGQTDRAREERLSVRLVLEGLDLRPGQTVLDIGAGRGYLTFPMAKALEGTGKVYATDVETDAVEHIRSVSQKEGLANVSPVRVSRERLDPFYREHTFDRVILSHVFEYLDHPVPYLQELRPSLRKGTGRLFVISPKPVAGLGDYQIRSLRAVLTVLRSRGATFPVFARLEPDQQAFVLKWDAKMEIPPQEQERLTAALRRLLEDPRLYADLSEYAYGTTEDSAALFRKLHMGDIELAKWLVTRLDAEGVFEKKWADLAEDERSDLMFLNQILLTATFPNGLLRRYNVGNRLLPYFEKRSILARMKAAGYDFLREHDTLHAHYFLEFGRAN